MEFAHTTIADGTEVHFCDTDKFSTVTVKIFIQQDLTKETVAPTALIPALLRRGSRGYPTTRKLARRFEDLYGSSFGADILKIGERQIVEFYFDFVAPSLVTDGEQLLQEGIHTFFDVLFNPLVDASGFGEEYFQQEKANMRRHVEGLINDKRSYAVHRAIGHMCGDEPFGLYKYGDVKSIEALTNTGVYQCYQRLFAANPMDIFVVGPTAHRFVQALESIDLPRQAAVSLSPVTTKAAVKPQEVLETRDVQQAILVLGFRTGVRFPDEGYHSLVVYNGILGAFPHSKLFRNVREQASLAYYIGSSLEGSKGLLTIVGGIDSEKYDQAVGIVRQQVDAMAQGDITDEELTRTKKALVSGLRTMSDNPASIIDRNVLGVVHRQLRSDEEVIRNIQSVTKAQVASVAQQVALDTVYFLAGTGGRDQ